MTAAQSHYDLARATRDAARSDAQRAAAQLSRYEIRAPFAGVVVNKAAQAGEIISPVSAGGGFTRTGICTLVDMSSLEIEVDVSESYIARVAEGQRVEAVLDAYPDQTFPAHVIATIPSADRSRATVRVRIGFDHLDPRILPEMAISVRFLDQPT
jgi:multidrug resistance efflux pump